jgi:hypothetical protein
MIDCDFDLEPAAEGHYKCRVCGWRNKHPLANPPRRNCPKGEPEIAGGPGTELHAILAGLGFTPSRKCRCEDRRRQMDRLGAAGCEERIEEIVSWLTEAADDTVLGKFAPGAVKRAAARAAVVEAIRRSRASA